MRLHWLQQLHVQHKVCILSYGSRRSPRGCFSISVLSLHLQREREAGPNSEVTSGTREGKRSQRQVEEARRWGTTTVPVAKEEFGGDRVVQATASTGVLATREATISKPETHNQVNATCTHLST